MCGRTVICILHGLSFAAPRDWQSCVDHVFGIAAFFREGELGIDTFQCFGPPYPVALHNASYLGLFVHVRDNDVIKQSLCVCFKQERKIEQEYVMGVIASELLGTALVFGIDPRVDDRIQLLAFFRVAENNASKLSPIYFTFLIDDIVSKYRNNVFATPWNRGKRLPLREHLHQ